MKTAMFEPVLSQFVVGDMQARPGLIQHHLAMIAHPDIPDWLYRNQTSAETEHTFFKPFDCRIV
jgi:hypothetical protein